MVRFISYLCIMKKELEAFKKGYRVTTSGSVFGLRGKEIGLYKNNCGYYCFSFRDKDSKSHSVTIHRLQAFQKYELLLYNDGIMARHKNGIKEDNSYDNILIGTARDNQMDIPENIRMARSLYATSFMRKYHKGTVINYHISHGNSYKKTMNHFGISSKGTLHYILNK